MMMRPPTTPLIVPDMENLSKEEYENILADLQTQLEEERNYFEAKLSEVGKSLNSEYESMLNKAKANVQKNLMERVKEKDEIITELNKELDKYPEKDISVISISSSDGIEEKVANLSSATCRAKSKILQHYEKLYSLHQEALEQESVQKQEIKRLENELDMKTKESLEIDKKIESLTQSLNNQRLEKLVLMEANENLQDELESSICYQHEIIKDFEEY